MLFDGRRLEPDLVEGPFGTFSEDGFARLRFAAGACKIKDAFFFTPDGVRLSQHISLSF